MLQSLLLLFFFKRLTNFRNDQWLEAFEVVVGDRMLDVPGRILQTPGIIYGQVGIEFESLLNNLCDCEASFLLN